LYAGSLDNPGPHLPLNAERVYALTMIQQQKNYSKATFVCFFIYLGFIGLGLLFNPNFLAKYLSPDHQIIEKTFLQIRLAQIGFICIGLMGTFSLLKPSLKFQNIAIILVVILTFYTIGYYLKLGLIDDTYISLRYAENFAAGKGLVFNSGERVEGYTCFLWVILLGLVGKLNLSLVFFSKAFSLLAGIGTVLLLKSFSEKFLYCPKSSFFVIQFPIFFLLLNFPFIYWSFTGMETSLYLLFLLLSAFFLLLGSQTAKPGDWRFLISSFFLALAALTRPEAYVIFPINLLFLMILGRRDSMWLNLFYYSIIFIILSGTHLLWRYSYYGQLLPNTYYVKVGGASFLLAKKGINYLFNAFYPHILLILLVLLSLLKKVSKAKLYILSLVIVQILAVIYEGGDHFGGNRYLVSMIPFLVIIAFEEIHKNILGLGEYLANEYFSKYRMFFRNFLTTLILFLFCYGTFLFSFFWISNGNTAIYEVKAAKEWANVGKWLKQRANEKMDVLATPVAGAMPFFSELRTIDMLGLNDFHIAHKKVKMGTGYTGHEKYDNAYVLAQKPTYIYLGEGAANIEEVLEAKIKKGSMFYPDLIQNYFPNNEYQFFSGAYQKSTFSFFIRK
jgi:arabinofuranosyltransferase